MGPSASLSETQIKLPGITIDRKPLEVRIEATVWLDTGIPEHAVCRPKAFEHEKNNPLHATYQTNTTNNQNKP